MKKKKYSTLKFNIDVINFGLVKMRIILNKLNNPEKIMPPVIHVAGTNGKGSVISFLKSIFNTSGYTIHQYVSPHLIRFNERIIIKNKMVTNKCLYILLNKCKKKTKSLNLTFFEATTAMAFLAFSKHSADLILLETGLGGKYDSTNILNNILLSVITTISIDHVEFLGKTILKIANEKSGIIKNYTPCLISWQTSEVLNYLISKARKNEIRYRACRKHWGFKKINNGFKFINLLTHVENDHLVPKLQGNYQIMNACTVISILHYLKNHFDILIYNMNIGIVSNLWLSRMQKIKNKFLLSMLPVKSEIWLDGGHNTEGVKTIFSTFLNLDPMNTMLIIKITRERDIKKIFIFFQDFIKYIFIISLKTRLCNTHFLDIKNNKMLKIHFIYCFSIKEAVNLSIAKSNRKNIRIIICGSLFLMKDIQNLIND